MSMEDHIFFLYFNQNNISQQSEYRSRYENMAWEFLLKQILKIYIFLNVKKCIIFLKNCSFGKMYLFFPKMCYFMLSNGFSIILSK